MRRNAKKRAARQPRRAGRARGPAIVASHPKALTFAPGVAQFVDSSDALAERAAELEEQVTLTLAPRTRSGKAIQSARGQLTDANLEDFRPDDTAQADAAERARALGFEVMHMGRFGVTVRGPARLVAEVVREPLAIHARPNRSPVRATLAFGLNTMPPERHDLFAAPTTSLSIPATVSENIDHFVFIPPPMLFAPPSPTPPALPYHHLDEDAIRRLLRVPPGPEGNDVKVAIVDTGFFPHPYYAGRGATITRVVTPMQPQPDVDAHGHGTAIALNLLAVAPRVEVLGVQQSNPPQDAIEVAAEHDAAVISCSWGWDNEQSFPILEATIKDVVREGRIVLFASGNGQLGWPGSMPDVIAIGGVFADAADALQASDFASGFTSSLYLDRRVPDVCGLCGMAPLAVYIPMPCAPGCLMDVKFGGNGFPSGDATADDDGWVVASGTSSATPQVAGVVALMVEKARSQGRRLTPVEVRDALQQSAQPVERGRNAFGFPAVGHPNAACGFGLVDAAAALTRI